MGTTIQIGNQGNRHRHSNDGLETSIRSTRTVRHRHVSPTSLRAIVHQVRVTWKGSRKAKDGSQKAGGALEPRVLTCRCSGRAAGWRRIACTTTAMPPSSTIRAPLSGDLKAIAPIVAHPCSFPTFSVTSRRNTSGTPTHVHCSPYRP